MRGHTPGPWINHGRSPQPGLPHSAVAAKTLIARVYSEAFGDEAQETANACLIAAAPELLDALTWLLDETTDRIDTSRSSAGTIGDAAGGVRAAIAKATGGAT